MPPETGAAWRVEMLGGLRAVTQGRPNREPEPVVQFRTHKAALLLARLTLFPNRAHGREELADLMWPDAPADRGRANLSQTLVYLRQALREPRTGGLFIADHKTVRIARHLLHTDVAEWETAATHALNAASDTQEETLLRDALALYTGALLPGLYEDWICRERIRLDALRDALHDRLQTIQTLQAQQSPKTAPAHTRMPSPPVIRNAPLYLTRFFGREDEIARASQALCQNPPKRLLTLLGMGGIGKTRLALQIAHSCLLQNGSSLFGRIAFVPLAEAQSASHLRNALLHALGIQSSGMEDLEAVIRHLNNPALCDAGRPLLVLDNLEQLGDSAAPVVSRLLAGVPMLAVLATSRQPIGIAGEQEMLLGPLPAAVPLLVDRARLVCPPFGQTPESEEAVTRLCTLLEGVPLALELAATWARVLTPQQIVDRLHNRFDLLSLQGTSRAGGGAPKRHQSLRAAIAWSYDLLGPNLQTFFARLSVFRGGWTADAAQAITQLKDVSEPLLLLAERSLILAEADENTGDVRYRMLESLREFAAEQAEALGEDTSVSLNLSHVRYFAELSRKANEMVETGRGMRPAFALLGGERDNLRAAFAWLREMTAEPKSAASSDTAFVSAIQAGVQTILQSHWMWPVTETREHLCLAAEAAALLRDDTGNPLRASIVSQQGLYAFHAGNYAEAECHLHDALSRWEAIGDRKPFFTAKSRLAMLRNRTGNPDAAAALWTECLQFARETADPRREAALLTNLANTGRDPAESQTNLDRAVMLYRTHAPGSYVLSCSLNSRGAIAVEQGDWDTAEACLEEAHEIAVADGALGMIGLVKASLADLFTKTGKHLDRAQNLLEEAQALFEEKQESLRVAQVHQLRFDLALARGDGSEAVICAHQYLHLSCQLGRDASWLQNERVDLQNQLRAAGFETQAQKLKMPLERNG